MDRERPALNNPALKDTLWYGHRSVAYVRRPIQSQTMSDVQRVAGVRSAPVVVEAPRQIAIPEPLERPLASTPQYMPDVAAPKPVEPSEPTAPQFLPDVVAPPQRKVSVADVVPDLVASEVGKAPEQQPEWIESEARQATPSAQYMPDILPPKQKAALPAPENFQTLQDIIAPKSRVTATRNLGP